MLGECTSESLCTAPVWFEWSLGGPVCSESCCRLSVGFVLASGWEASRQEGHSSGSSFTKTWWAGPFLPASLPRLKAQRLPFPLELTAGPSLYWTLKDGNFEL